MYDERHGYVPTKGKDIMILAIGVGTWLSRQMCASVPQVAGSSPSGGSKSTSHSDLLLTARDINKYINK